MFVYERSATRRWCWAAGIEDARFDGAGFGRTELRTPYGTVNLSVQTAGRRCGARHRRGCATARRFFPPSPWATPPDAARVRRRKACLAETASCTSPKLPAHIRIGVNPSARPRAERLAPLRDDHASASIVSSYRGYMAVNGWLLRIGLKRGNVGAVRGTFRPPKPCRHLSGTARAGAPAQHEHERGKAQAGKAQRQRSRCR